MSPFWAFMIGVFLGVIIGAVLGGMGLLAKESDGAIIRILSGREKK